jgi:hypothetical protein
VACDEHSEASWWHGDGALCMGVLTVSRWCYQRYQSSFYWVATHDGVDVAVVTASAALLTPCETLAQGASVVQL